MNISAEDYVELNYLHVKPVMPLLERIKNDIKNETVNITLDVGCGSGRITMLLHEAIGFNRIVAIDVAQDMIASAINKYSRDNVEYFIQDISVNWDQLIPEVKALEGKVSLVFSNQVFQWIKNKNNAIKNIYRLLSTGGKIYVTLSAFYPIFTELTPEEQQAINSVINVTSVQNQFDDWTNLLITNKLTVTRNELLEHHFIIAERIWQKIMPNSHLKLLSIFAVSENQTQFNELCDKYSNVLLRGFDHEITKLVDESNGQLMVRKIIMSIYTHAFK